MKKIDNLDEFVEESQKLLSDIIISNKILNFQNQTTNNQQSIRTGGLIIEVLFMITEILL